MFSRIAKTFSHWFHTSWIPTSSSLTTVSLPEFCRTSELSFSMVEWSEIGGEIVFDLGENLHSLELLDLDQEWIGKFLRIPCKSKL